MSNFRQEIRELIDEAKTGSGMASALAVIVLLVCLPTILIKHYQTATVRYAFLIVVAVILALTCVLAVQYRRKLDGDKEAKSKVKARMKFTAEIYAALAILSFFLAFFRLGLELDRANYSGRAVHLEKLSFDLSKRICPSDPRLQEKCSQLNADINTVDIAISNRDERAVRDAIKKLSWDTKLVVGEAAPPWLDKELGAARIDDDMIPFTIVVLYMTLLCSSMAISRKIALAWSEKHA